MTEDVQRVALVTGATSGIGLEIAGALAQVGHRVFICARQEPGVAATVKHFQDQGLEVDGTSGDVTDPADVDRLVSTCTDRFGSLEILVNNAGKPGGGPIAQMADEFWRDVIDTNLNSTFLVTKRALSAGGLGARGWGRIINISSTGGKQGVVHGAAYSAAKHGVVGLSKAMGLELAKTGITVNAVCPGFVETPMAQRVRGVYAGIWDVDEQEAYQRITARVPIGRYVEPSEVAAMVLYLIGPGSDAVTGQAMNVCGGLGNY
jgi:ketoreductase